MRVVKGEGRRESGGEEGVGWGGGGMGQSPCCHGLSCQALVFVHMSACVCALCVCVHYSPCQVERVYYNRFFLIPF